MKVTKFFIIAAIAGATLTGCSDKPEPKLEIGQAYQGGIIAYIDATREHGLIVAPEDQSTGIVWWNGVRQEIGSLFTHIGGGKGNTDKIVDAQGAGNYAAQICKDLPLNGYSDWFLPSKDELNELYKNRVKIGGFSNNWYWSSSESNTYFAYFQDFTNGNQSTADKSRGFIRVRAVRYF